MDAPMERALYMDACLCNHLRWNVVIMLSIWGLLQSRLLQEGRQAHLEHNQETIAMQVSRICCRILLCCTIKPEWINRSCRVLKTGVRPIGNHRNDYVARLKRWKTNVTVAYFIPSWSTIGYDWLRYLIVIYNKIIIPFHHLLFNSLLAWSDFTASVHVQLHVTRKQPWMSYRQYAIQGCFLLYFLTLHSHTVHEYIAHVDLLVTGN